MTLSNLLPKLHYPTRLEKLVDGSSFTVPELFGFATKGKSRGKSVAKYANPDNRMETWTGRGRKPNWLLAKLKKGASAEDFSI